MHATDQNAYLSSLELKLNELVTRDQCKNYDEDRYGKKRPINALKSFARKVKNRRAFFFRSDSRISYAKAKLKKFKEQTLNLHETYSLLEDEYSRNILLEVYLLRLLGMENVKLSRNSEKYWTERSAAKALVAKDQEITAQFVNGNIKLPFLDLRPIGFDVKLFCGPAGVDLLFLKKQYEYSHSKPLIAAQNGDVVIDGGSCWGDTALYFASKVGPSGQVIGFEFLPDNLTVLRENLKLNPKYSSNIEIVERPIWGESGKKLYARGSGPATRVSELPEAGAQELQTMSIDDLVQAKNLERVDFIKMDIEGAELAALNGSLKTIRRFKPTLAICVYHKPNDLVDIPQFIKSLHLDYKMWLDHFTIFGEETVLFCKVQ